MSPSPAPHTIPLRSAFGCDSTIHLNISTRPPTISELYDTIRECAYIFADTVISTARHYTFHFTDQHGCDSLVRLFLHASPCLIWVPNAFTPAMPTNNQFAIFNSDLLQADVYTYDRNGLLVTQFDGLTSSWDGTHPSTPCPEGTYVYLIVYRCVQNSSYEHHQKGTATLLR